MSNLNPKKEEKKSSFEQEIRAFKEVADRALKDKSVPEIPKHDSNPDPVSCKQEKRFPDNMQAFTMGLTGKPYKGICVDPIIVYYFLN